jgi:dienelactone hydrolase
MHDGFRRFILLLRSPPVKAIVQRCASVALLATICLQNISARADELVQFDAAPYILGQLQQRRAIEHGEMAVPSVQGIEGYLSKPVGDGPFPAVIYLHGCSGLAASSRERLAAMFNGWGYVFLAVDSFATRGIREACDRPMPAREADALGALIFLSKLPFVNRERIAAVGASQGGIVTMHLVSTHDVQIYNVPAGLNFRAAVAFYPLCSAASVQLAIPTLLLIGELDDWTPAENCQRWMKLRDGKGALVKFIVYPGAYHAFDFPGLKNGVRSFGHWLKYDPGAAQASAAEMHEFLAAYLSQ